MLRDDYEVPHPIAVLLGVILLQVVLATVI